MSSQAPENNPPDLFPKSDGSLPNIPIEEQYKKTDKELAAWDHFFSKMTRKITKLPVELSPEAPLPPPLSNNINISQGAPSSPPKPTFPLKPKTEPLSPNPQNKPITSRFKPTSPNLTVGGVSKPLTSLIKPIGPTSVPPSSPPVAQNPPIASPKPAPLLFSASPHSPVAIPKTPANASGLNLRPPESSPPLNSEFFGNSETPKPKLGSLLQGAKKETSRVFSSEPYISIKSLSNPLVEPSTDMEITPPEEANKYSKNLEADPFLKFPNIEKNGNLENSSIPPKKAIDIEKIDISALSEQTLFRSKVIDPAQFKFCSVCTQMMPPAKVFICERCEGFSCLKHRKGAFWCETCFSKINQFHPFYEKIAESLKQNLIKTKNECSGAITLEELMSIFKTLSLSVSAQGLLVIGNDQMKRGICFANEDVLFVSFGTSNIISIGKLLVQNRILTEDELLQAAEFQKQHQMKFGDALITLQLISEQTIQMMLNEQAFREILSITRWPKSNYKFRPGQIPKDLLAKMVIDTTIVLQDPPEFKSALMAIFHHMKFILAPGFFQITSQFGRIGFLVYKSQIVLANFKGELSFGEYLVHTKRITNEYWNKIQGLPLSLEEYLIRDKIMTVTQMNQCRQEYVGQEMGKFLRDPDYRCHFYEGEATENDLSGVSILVLGINLEDLLYDLWPRAPRIPPPTTSAEIFALIFDKNSSDKMSEALHFQLHQSLECFEKNVRFTEFEKNFLTLSLIKSSIVNALQCMEQQGILLREQKLLQEAGWIGECIQKISK
ncbi:MAG: hypothetical protein AABZ60_01625 [Planctomycetota bacterium]